MYYLKVLFVAIIFCCPQLVVAQCQARVSQFDLPDNSFPYDAAFSPDGQLAFVINRDAGNVIVLDSARNEVLNTIAVGSQPLDVEVSDDGRWVVVANSASGTLSILDLANGYLLRTVSVTGGQPYRIKLVPNSPLAVIGVTQPGVASRISVVDLSLGQEVRSFITNGHGVTRLRFYDGGDPHHGRHAYHYTDFILREDQVIIPWFARLTGFYGQPDYSLISIYNWRTGESQGTITTAPYPAGLALSPDGDLLVVSHSDSFVRQVSVVDLLLRSIVRVISTPDHILGWQVQLSASSAEAFVQAQSGVLRVDIQSGGYAVIGNGGGDTEFVRSRDSHFLLAGGFYPTLYRLEDQTVMQYLTSFRGYDLAISPVGDLIVALGNQATHQNNQVSLIDYSEFRADRNLDGVIDSRDFFNFLAEFFMGTADLNGDGITNSSDFFQYLGLVESCAN